MRVLGAEGGASPASAGFCEHPRSPNLTIPQNKAIGTYGQDPNTSVLGSQIIREIVIPELTKDQPRAQLRPTAPGL